LVCTYETVIDYGNYKNIQFSKMSLCSEDTNADDRKRIAVRVN